MLSFEYFGTEWLSKFYMIMFYYIFLINLNSLLSCVILEFLITVKRLNESNFR